MKKKRKPNIGKKLMSSVLAMTMAMELAPVAALTAKAAVSEETVTALAKAYDGDEERARAELEALYQSGIIDESGNMIVPEIRENGQIVSLDDVAVRIANGEEVGALTANGYAVTKNKIMQLSEAKGLFEVIRVMQEGANVEITEEHLSNYEQLKEKIKDGTIDLESIIMNGGTLSTNDLPDDESEQQEDIQSIDMLAMPRMLPAPLLAAAGNENANANIGGFPSTKTSEGEVETDADGKYTQPFIGGNNYENSHAFQLAEPENKTYYTDSKYQGIITDGVVSLSCADTATAGGTVTVTATLNNAQSVPVSFDWSAAGGSIGASGSGTVKWNAGETGAKTFTVNVAGKGDQLWDGKRSFVISVGNVKNALLNGNATTWSKTVSVSASDRSAIDLWVNVYGLPGSNQMEGDYTTQIGSKNKKANRYMYYTTSQTIDSMPIGCRVRLIMNLSAAIPQNKQKAYYYYDDQPWYYDDDEQRVDYNGAEAYIYLKNPDDASKELKLTLDASAGHSTWTKELSAEEVRDYVSGIGSKGSSTITGTIKYNFWHNNNMQHTEKSYSVWDVAANYLRGLPTLSSVTLQAIPYSTVTDVSVPSGTYYSGQVVPITVTLDHYATATESAKLIVNNVECPLLDSVGTLSKQFTFGYTVKSEDAGTINVQSINMDGMDPGFELTPKSFGIDENVKLVSTVKQNSLDLANVKYGISDDNAGEQDVTVVIPFKSGASIEWVNNECGNCTTNGHGISMSLPDYGDVTLRDYLNGAYFSYDNGKTRFPVYIVRQGAEERPVALVCRFAPHMNASDYLRKDTLNLFMDMTVGIPDSTTYLDTWENVKKDTKGFAYFDGTAKTNSAPVFVGANYTLYTKCGIMFDPAKYISRGDFDYAARTDTENGYLNYDDGNHVFLWDKEHPENQYDVEIIANDAFYNSVVRGFRAEDSTDLTLRYKCSNRKNFTFTDPKYFTWESSDTNIATIREDDTDKTKVHISFTGNPGEVEFKLTAKNGLESSQFDLPSVKLTVLEGKTPFLNISEYSQLRPALTYTDVDVAFSSNITARNAQAGQENTTFTAKLYKAKAVDGETDTYEKEGEPIWTSDFNSTLEELLTHITVPGDQLTHAGAYALEITTEYIGGDVDGKPTESKALSASAYIVAKQAPVSVHLNKLDSYYVTNNNIPQIGYTVTSESDTTQVEYTIQKSGEEVSDRRTASNGRIPFSASKPDSLKEAYTITVYARNSEDEDWSVDSMLLTVYNPDILHQIVSEVAAGEIGGTTGGTGDQIDGKTINMDNHDKVQDYIGENGYELNFDDFTTLRTDMSLQKIVSLNYGDTVYGMLSDKMEWESSDSQKVSVNYKQGGIYSDIRNYNYTTYAPATDFLLVGKEATGTGEKVTIKATHANTGIESSFDVTTKTLKDQLYVFKFNPPIKTDVIYTNGKGEKRTLSSNDKGELAVYEPDGIFDPVMVRSENEGKVYVGTLFPSDLQTGERDVASLQLYPCNNLRLRTISDAELTFRTPDGKLYNGDVIIRGGVYKNGIYCPGAKLSVDNNLTKLNGREDIHATVTNGKLKITLDPTQFKHDPNSTEEFGGAQSGDTITYVFEYRFADTYQPGYVTLNAYTDVEGASSPSDSVVNMRENVEGNNNPQITKQTLQQYMDGKPLNETTDVTNYKKKIGISPRYDKAELITDIALSGETVERDEKGYTTYNASSMPSFELRIPNRKAFTGQTKNYSTYAEQIIDLADLKDSTLYVFPFSAVPMSRSIYTMNDMNLTADGITTVQMSFNETDNNKPDGEKTTLVRSTPYSSMNAVFKKGGTEITEKLGFSVANLSHSEEVGGSGSGSKAMAQNMGAMVMKELASEGFKGVSGGELIGNGLAYLGGFVMKVAQSAVNVLVVPTEDPSVYRIVVLFMSDGRVRNYDEKEGFTPWASAEGVTGKDEHSDTVESNVGGVPGLSISGGYGFNTFKNLMGSGNKFDMLGITETKTKEVTDEDGNTKTETETIDHKKDITDKLSLAGSFDWKIDPTPIPYGTIVIEARNETGEAWNNKILSERTRDKWKYKVVGGSVGINSGVLLFWNSNFFCGPVPCNVKIDLKLNPDVEVRFASKNDQLATMVDFAMTVTLHAFVGVGVDLSSLFTFKAGAFGEVSAMYELLYLDDPNYMDLTALAEVENPEGPIPEEKKKRYGHKLRIKGQVGLEVDIKFTLINYKKKLCSVGFNWNKKWDDFDKILENWEKQGYTDLSGTTTNGQRWDATLTANGVANITVDGGKQVENRDYLKSVPLSRLQSKSILSRNATSDGMVELFENAYPYSNPVVTNDGSYMLYLSDNGNPDAPESVVHYAVKDGNGYTDMGRVDTSEDNILADSSVVASGTGENAFAAWVKQLDSLEKEMKDKVSYDDLGMMMNATEIYGSVCHDGQWTTERLTDNAMADMSPTIASSGDRGIVAWRSLSATAMPEEDGEQDITAMFNSENSINYRIFDGTEWKEAKIAYNGSAGTVSAVDSAMLSDGTSMLVYTVRTGEDNTSTETFYTLIDQNGDIITTGRLTNDDSIDTNAQVSVVGDQFVVGWYSEHASNEAEDSGEPIVSHDIRLARINANGSVDAEFPQSIGGGADSDIGADFHFSAPEGNDDLSKLAIVWSQPKNSDAEEDAGKYQLNAVRFFEENGAIGVTAPTKIAETGKHYVIDAFDTYTDENDEIKAVLIGSDYNSVDGISAFDTIDLSDTPIEVVDEEGNISDMLTILDQEPVASMKLASGAFQTTAIEATADTDLTTLMPELEHPVQFTVHNTGTSIVNTINAEVGGQHKEFTDLNLLPGQTTVLTFSYNVPQTVSDVSYTLTADRQGTASGELILNRPDVGIADIQVVREGNKTRDIKVNLNNNLDIPLEGSGKTVMLGFYRDIDHTEQIGDLIKIDDAASLKDIDDDIYTYQQSMSLTELLGENVQEVPAEGVHVFAYAWVADSEELSTFENSASVVLESLLAKYDSQIMMNSALIEEDDNNYKIVADISNNSLQSAEVGSVVADILDSRNRVLKTVNIIEDNDDESTLDGEESKTISVSAGEIKGEPATVVLRSSEQSVLLDAVTNKGIADTTSILLNKDGKPAGMLPGATRSGYKFEGWFTKPVGGEQITNDTELEAGVTLYAQFSYIKRDQGFKITMEDHEYDGTAHEPKINGTVYGKMTTEYFDADTGEQLSEAPTEIGHYIVKAYADGNYYYNEYETTADYWITTSGMYHITVTNGTVNGKPSGEFAPGTTVEIKADAPDNGYKFSGWKSDGKIVSKDASYTFEMTSENVEFEAVYEEDVYSQEVAEAAIADGVAVDLADAVLKDGTKARFVLTPTLADGWTVDAYGIVYDKTGAVTDAETAKSKLVLNGSYVTKTCSAKDGTPYALNVTPIDGNTIWAAGYITVSKDGKTATIYTEPMSGNVAEMQITENTKLDLADAALKDNAKARFVLTPDIPDGYTIEAYGIVYDKTGAITDAETAKNGLVLGGSYATKTCSAKDGTPYALNVTPTNGNTIWAVGYVTVTKDGVTKTVYTEPKSGNVAELQIRENVKVNLVDAVLKDGTKARFVLTPEIAEGWTVKGYGIVYDKTGAIADAETAKNGLVLGGDYVTKICSAKDGTPYALNITPTNDNTIWAVGYITAEKDGKTVTIYTEPKSAKVSELS